MGALNLEIRPDWVGVLWFDLPGEKINKLSTHVMQELEQKLDEVAKDSRLRGLVIASRKKDVFIAGADVEEIKGVRDEKVAFDACRRGQLILHRIAQLAIPTVAAIDGACVGGGLELALACTYRIATENPKTSLGLVEVKLGIIPGFGGTQRLPPVVGLQESLKMILNGSTVDGKKALKIGLVSACVPQGILIEEAAALALKASHGGARPKKFKPKGALNWVLEKTPFGRALVFKKSREAVMKATKGQYPAPLAALEVIRKTHGMPIEKGLEVEAHDDVPLIVSDVSKNLIHLFFLMEGVKKMTGVASEVQPLPVTRMGVLGAGVMGGGIAQLGADRGLTVRMKDIQEEALSKGLAEANRLFQSKVKRRRLKRHEAQFRMDRISPTLSYDGFGTLDVVVEAVVEKMGVKRAVLRELEERTGGKVLFATNTSSLPITEIAAEARYPDRVVGMHFFNPVNRMPLVEVIRGEKTSDEAVATIFTLAKAMGKVPVSCNDGPGFLVNRLLMPYMNEAAYLLLEGVPVDAVDKAMLAFGMPMGPVRLMDEVGLDVAYHVGTYLESKFPDRMKGAPLLKSISQTKFLGKKGGAGFYFYDEKGKETVLNPDLLALLPPAKQAPPDIVLQERMVLPMINEASRILADGIVKTPGEVDLGMIMGTGFPPFRGGLMRYADALGLARVAERLSALAQSVDPRFAPSPQILELAKKNGTFYAHDGAHDGNQEA
jgi:3-hydroxyacyl-CoA dehydrogenase / enoyl-CoA hydratase / 3-hydroxybutyryl-CoA epimerase